MMSNTISRVLSLDEHLSNPAVAGRLKPPPEDDRANHMSSHGVAPDRVYSDGQFPAVG